MLKVLAKKARVEINSLREYLGYDENMKGMCLHASYLLSRAINLAGIGQSRIGLGYYIKGGNHRVQRLMHSFVVLDDTIIDITATQFGIRNHVLITNVKDYRYQEHSDARPIRDWHKHQQPNTYRKEHKEMLHRVVGRYIK